MILSSLSRGKMQKCKSARNLKQRTIWMVHLIPVVTLTNLQKTYLLNKQCKGRISHQSFLPNENQLSRNLLQKSKRRRKKFSSLWMAGLLSLQPRTKQINSEGKMRQPLCLLRVLPIPQWTILNSSIITQSQS